MNTRRTSSRTVGEEIENAESTPQGNQNAPYVQDATNDQLQVNPWAMKNSEVRVDLFQMAQAITTQAQ